MKLLKVHSGKLVIIWKTMINAFAPLKMLKIKVFCDNDVNIVLDGAWCHGK